MFVSVFLRLRSFSIHQLLLLLLPLCVRSLASCAEVNAVMDTPRRWPLARIASCQDGAEDRLMVGGAGVKRADVCMGSGLRLALGTPNQPLGRCRLQTRGSPGEITHWHHPKDTFVGPEWRRRQTPTDVSGGDPPLCGGAVKPGGLGAKDRSGRRCEEFGCCYWNSLFTRFGKGQAAPHSDAPWFISSFNNRLWHICKASQRRLPRPLANGGPPPPAGHRQYCSPTIDCSSFIRAV